MPRNHCQTWGTGHRITLGPTYNRLTMCVIRLKSVPKFWENTLLVYQHKTENRISIVWRNTIIPSCGKGTDKSEECINWKDHLGRKTGPGRIYITKKTRNCSTHQYMVSHIVLHVMSEEGLLIVARLYVGTTAHAAKVQGTRACNSFWTDCRKLLTYNFPFFIYFEKFTANITEKRT